MYSEFLNHSFTILEIFSLKKILLLFPVAFTVYFYLIEKDRTGRLHPFTKPNLTNLTNKYKISNIELDFQLFLVDKL